MVGVYGSTGFGTSNSANDHAESIRSAVASAMPSGYSVSRTNNVVTITAPSASGNVNDVSKYFLMVVVLI